MPKKRIGPIGSSRQRASSILSAIKGLQYDRSEKLESVQYEIEGLKLDNEQNQGLIEIALQSIQYGKNKAELSELKNKSERGVNAYRKMTGSKVLDHKVIRMKDVRERDDLSIWDIGKEEWVFDDGKTFSLAQVMVFDDYYQKNNFDNIWDNRDATEELFRNEGARGFVPWTYDTSDVSTIPLEGSVEDATRVAMLKDIDISKRTGEFLWKTRGQIESWAATTQEKFLGLYNAANAKPGFIAAKNVQELSQRFMVDGETSIMGKDAGGRSAFDYLAFIESGYDPQGIFGAATDEFTFIHPLNSDGSRDYGVLGINDRHVREIDWKNLYKGNDGKNYGKDVFTYQKSAIDGKPDTTTRAIVNYLEGFLPSQTEEQYGLFGRKTKMVAGENEWEDELAELVSYVPDKEKNPYDVPVLNEDFEFITTIKGPE